MIKKIALVAALVLPVAAGSCQDGAQIATQNMIKAGDNFEVMRNIKFYNTMHNVVLLEVEGLCSYDLSTDGQAFSYICKVGSNEYRRNTLIRSETVTAVVEQLDTTKLSRFHYRVTWNPQVVIPDIDLRGSMDELTTNSSELNQ